MWLHPPSLCCRRSCCWRSRPVRRTWPTDSDRPLGRPLCGPRKYLHATPFGIKIFSVKQPIDWFGMHPFNNPNYHQTRVSLAQCASAQSTGHAIGLTAREAEPLPDDDEYVCRKFQVAFASPTVLSMSLSLFFFRLFHDLQ